MKAALSSLSCFLLCLRRSPGDTSSEHSGSSLSLQTRGHHSASSIPQTLCVMSEGDITVLPFGPSSLDLSKQEPRTLTKLYSMNGGYHLRILSDGTVNGGRQEDDPYDILRLKAVSAGVVVIKGETTGRYLAMNKNGRLYGAQAVNDECYFLEKYEENHHNTYRSQKYSWYVALKRNGQPKAGPDTHQGQKAIFFLPRPAGNM
ncbi:putative fibroblast growth factor 1 isoform X1 [Archocentrus centrarchus]|uniref:putative fibroblast growth factor 1 isoform X1 n=2 Tax=Archocentrus centrarchus TaxID=63155 RepID=UPI0011EA3942|nr:putative fibroblast growth factor 1 isoform X1 [Archocentrus centrarchus]